MTTLKLLPLIFTLTFFLSNAQAAEPWKGNTKSPPFEFGMLTGMSLYGTDTNWTVLGTGAYLIVPEGWADDIDDRVWIEGELGPTFFSKNSMSQTGMQWSAHVRWDFSYSEEWVFYGLGGLGGFVLPSSYGGSLTLHPRFGVGVEFQTKAVVMLRAELSHELIALGVAVNF
jgi:hypothetical protein